MYLIFAISNRCELNDFWHCIHKWSWCKFSINKQGLKKCVQKGLKKCDYNIYMDMNTATPPKKGLKARPYSMDMEDHIVTLPKRGLKTRPYSMDMNKDIATLPKKGLRTRPYNIGMEKMEKKDLKKLTEGQLIKLLLKRVSNHEGLLDNDPFKDEVAREPTPPPRTGKWESVKPKPIPRKSVNEDGYKPIPKPRTDRPLQIPKIKELNRALKGHAQSYEIELQDNLNPLDHFTKTRPLTESHLEDLLKTMKGFKFIETLEVTFEKDTID